MIQVVVTTTIQKPSTDLYIVVKALSRVESVANCLRCLAAKALALAASPKSCSCLVACVTPGRLGVTYVTT